MLQVTYGALFISTGIALVNAMSDEDAFQAEAIAQAGQQDVKDLDGPSKDFIDKCGQYLSQLDQDKISQFRRLSNDLVLLDDLYYSVAQAAYLKLH
jgi:hypothetical protein